MDGEILTVTIFLIATFAGALVAGVAGFAFGLVAAAMWLHVLTPPQSATLIIGYGLVVQGIAVWKLRAALDWKRLWPFFLGGTIGVPVGTMILHVVSAEHMKVAIGVFLILYAIYSLARPAFSIVQTGRVADTAIGLLNGALGGITGLAGIIVTVWCGVRGWPKDVQRAVFQPVAVATFAMSALAFGIAGAISRDILVLWLMGLPVLLAGTWLGLKLYGRLDEARFRRVVLWLLLGCGVLLVVAFLR